VHPLSYFLNGIIEYIIEYFPGDAELMDRVLRVHLSGERVQKRLQEKWARHISAKAQQDVHKSIS
jgi:hypothetical protein